MWTLRLQSVGWRDWCRDHSEGLIRLTAVVVVFGVTVVLGYACHGFIGPPG